MMDIVSRRLGFKVKDRSFRYSFEGRANWGSKEAHIVDRFLTHHLPEGTRTIVKGVLHVGTAEDFATLKTTNTRSRSRFTRE